MDLSLDNHDVIPAFYADDNTIYGSRDSIDGVIASLQISVKKCFQWFSANQMKGASGKCHFTSKTQLEVVAEKN